MDPPLPAQPVAPALPVTAPATEPPAARHPVAPHPVELHPVERACSAWLEVRFDGNRCIHARQCVTGAPATFLADIDGPWIRPAMTPLQDLIAVIRRCPSGALSY